MSASCTAPSGSTTCAAASKRWPPTRCSPRRSSSTTQESLPAVAAVAEKRDFSDPIALNWTQDGTDIDFGSLSKQLIGYGVRNGNVALFGHEVRNLSRESDGQLGAQGAQPPHRRHPQDQHQVRLHWGVRRRTAAAAEGRYPGDQGVFGGFPVGGKFLRTSNPEVAARHRAKVYGLPALGAPRMSALHLDARIINAKSWLLFGPFAGWSPKFLKQGNVTDLPLSVKPNNLLSMLDVGVPGEFGQLPGQPIAAV